MAESLISTMSGSFDPSVFTDDYKEAMAALLEAKQAGGDVVRPEEPEDDEDDGSVVDLMSALRRSVERAGTKAPADDDSDDDAAEAPARKAPAKKAPAKKAAATKAAPAKKAPAKKAAASKSA
jgi:DNA end-binding protein Ku